MEFSIKDYLVYKSGQIENIQLQSWPIETLHQYISTILQSNLALVNFSRNRKCLLLPGVYYQKVLTKPGMDRRSLFEAEAEAEAEGKKPSAFGRRQKQKV